MDETWARHPAQRAWKRLMALGGWGVWDPSFVVISLADTAATDDDLAVFHDFPSIQILDISNTSVTGAGLVHLDGASSLETLVIIGTKLGRAELAAFRKTHPEVKIISEPPPRGSINRFTGQPI